LLLAKLGGSEITRSQRRPSRAAASRKPKASAAKKPALASSKPFFSKFRWAAAMAGFA
jgi:hypothetical protein